MSIDAALPYSFSTVDGQILYVPHSADNCVLTLLPLNYAKSSLENIGWRYYILYVVCNLSNAFVF